MLFFNYNYIWSVSNMWDRPLIFKELTEVYFVNGEKFWTKRDAEIYIAELEMKEIGKRARNTEKKKK